MYRSALFVEAAFRPLYCGVVATVIFGSLFVTESQAFPNPRSMMNNIRNQQKQQHDQMIKTLQAQNEQGQKLIVTAEQEQASAAAELQSSKAQFATAKQNHEASQAAVKAAALQLKELEEKILEAQSPDSEYGKAAALLAERKSEADSILFKILGIAPPVTPYTDKERVLATTKLSADNKAKLKGSVEYTKANQQVDSAHDKLVAIEKKTFEQNAEWKTASENRLRAQQDVKASQDAEKSAHSAMSASQRKASEANEQVSNLRQGMAAIRSELMSLGAPVK